MARNKYPEETVNQILDVSLKLFLEKGYDQTTIQDIVDHLGGLTRGAIYHHFKSKEEIIDAVTERIFQENNWFGTVEAETELNGLQKIQKILSLALSDKNQLQLFHSMSSLTKNPKFITQHLTDTITFVAPLVEKLVKEGIADGSIHTNQPKEAAEVIMLLINVWCNPMIFEVDKDQLMNKFLFLKDLMERIGVPIIDNDILKKCDGFANSLLNSF